MTLTDALKGFEQEHENRAPSKLRARRLRSTPHKDTGEMIGSGRRVGGKLGRGFSKEINQGPQQPGFGGFPPHGLPMQPGFQTIPSMGGPNSQIPFERLPSGHIGQTGIFTPWLHKTKAFVPLRRPGMPGRPIGAGPGGVGRIIAKPTQLLRNKNKKWNGKIEKQTPPTVFLNKSNYLGLKERLGKLIHDEVSKQTEGNESMKKAILSQIIPDPGKETARLRGKKTLTKNRQQPQKPALKLKMKNLKGEVSVFGQEKPAGTKLRAKPAQSAGKLRNKGGDNTGIEF